MNFLDFIIVDHDAKNAELLRLLAEIDAQGDEPELPGQQEDAQ